VGLATSGFQRFERGQGPSTLELTVLGAGRFQRCGAGLVGRGGAHPVSLAEVEAGRSGMRRAARARRRIRVDSLHLGSLLGAEFGEAACSS
jgi:hypothetical protein